jgi:hypothetical protein
MGFGQIIALVLLIGSLIDVLTAIGKWCRRKREGSTLKPSYEQLPDEV